MSIYVSYKFKIMAVAVSCVVLVSGLVTVFSIYTLRKTGREISGLRGVPIVHSALNIIDGDEFERLSKNPDENDSWHNETNAKLASLTQATECKYLYAMAQKSGNKFYMILDGTDKNAEGYSPCGTIEDVSEYGTEVFETLNSANVTIADIDYTEDWGWTQSIYAPIKNSRGTVVGIVGCDFSADELQKTLNNTSLIIDFIAGFGIILALIALTRILQRFFKKIGSVTEAIRQLTGGSKDLTAKLPSKKDNEIGQISRAVNSVMEDLNVLIRETKSSINTLSGNTTEVVDESEKIVELAESTAATFNEIEDKLHNQNSLTEQSFEEIENAKSCVQTLTGQLEKQNKAIEKSAQAIDEISKNISQADTNIQKITSEYSIIVEESSEGQRKQDEVKSLLQTIEQMSKQLSEANEVIAKIASETNLLAMNAAIEAAHAGDAGKGFSVVADEIRKLAETSAEQTHSVQSVIKKTRVAIDDIVKASNDSSDTFNSLGVRIKNMNSLVNEIKGNIDNQNHEASEILSMMQVLENSSREISSSSNEMDTAISQVYKSIEYSQQVSQEILSSAGETQREISNVQELSKEASESSRNSMNLAIDLKNTLEEYKTN